MTEQEQVKLKTECVIVDIDGTLANLDHRRHFVTGEKKDLDSFYKPELIAKDTVIEPVARTVRALQTRWQIIYVTGRPERLREVTRKWLVFHRLWFFPYQLYMRPDGNFKPDTGAKSFIYDKILESGLKPFLAIDDRASVVSMWRSKGLVCLQCNEGDF